MAVKYERSFISQYPPLSSMVKEDVNKLWKSKEINLYIHIPYCARKCDFCYYKSIELGDAPVPNEYVEALKCEIELYARYPEMAQRQIRSIYIGGGTPTTLSEEQLASVIMLIKSRFKIAENDFEFCCEARPGISTTFEKLQLMRRLGLRRLSIGCQSLDDAVLIANGRHHQAVDFYQTFELARKAGIYSINVDLMSGMVNQSQDSFLDSLDSIIKLSPENITIYKMEVFLNNELYTQFRQGKIDLISDEAEYQYAWAGYQKLLSQGYSLSEHLYFLKAPEYVHVQRREIWHGGDMLGIGLSAHSMVDGFIFQNDANISNYVEKIDQGVLPVQRAHKITCKEKMARQAVFGIKNRCISRSKFVEEFGIDIMDVYGEQLQELERQNYITIHPDVIRTTITGSIIADDIARKFYQPEHKQMILAHVKRPEKQSEVI